jgi:hypothetical protein
MIDFYEENDGTQWDSHLKLKHCSESFVLDNIYPFILYGDAHPHFAYFCSEKTDEEITMNVYKRDWDIDDKCPYAMYKTHFGNTAILKNHVKNNHKMYTRYSKVKFPPFWKFLKMNTSPNQVPNFFEFLNILKHP